MKQRSIFDVRLLLLTAAMSLQLVHPAPVTPGPLAEDVSSQESTPGIPEFLMDLYECWADNRHPSVCMPDRDTRQVNIVRSLIGEFDIDWQAAVLSDDRKKHIENSISFVFNSSSSAMISDDVIYKALLRVHKSSLSQDLINALQSMCNLEDLELQVYSTVNVNDNQQVVKLEETMSFGSLSKSEWLSFSNMKHVYQTILQQSQVLRLHLTIGGSCQGLSPTLFGITDSLSMYQPELIGYATNQAEDKALMENLKSVIWFQRQKRQADPTGGSGGNTFENDTRNYNRSNPNPGLVSRDPATIAELKKAKCNIYEFNVSFVEIGWERYIIQPLVYRANFCAGRCTWPLKDMNKTIRHTKHSFIQSIVNHAQPNLVPQPCCTPNPYTMRELPIMTRDGNNFTVRRWKDMIAASCGCF